MGFSLSAYLDAKRAQLEALLRQQLERVRPEVPPRLFEAMAYSLYDGGKRLRPVLCLAFAEAVRPVLRPGADEASTTALVEAAACALEMVHTYSLIHDDLPAMDDDALRRGRPTNHKVFGEAMAILAGDALLTEAFAAVTRVEGAGDRVAQVVRELAEAAGAAGMVGGQVLDIATDRPAEEAYLTRMHTLKTGRLLQAACRLGVLSAGGDDASFAAATAYGASVGLAFQIVDDILDVTATPEVLGKPTGADAEAGRHTYPSVLGLERSKALAREQVDRAVDAVRPFGDRGVALRALAELVVERAH